MARPKDYREQDGCWNCKHVYEKEEYDEASEFFCTVDGIAQPSLSFDGYGVYDVDTVSKRNKLMQKMLNSWYEWADPRQVKECGKCGQWEKREVNDEPPNSP